jgi:hypothetical protein
MSELFQRLYSEIEKIPLVDTHEHLMSESMRLNQKIDFFYWFSHYASSDLVSAGMPHPVLDKLLDHHLPLDDRWAEFEPFWRVVRTTAYGRVLLMAAGDLFSVDDINTRTYQELSEKISASNFNGWYEVVLKERANIGISVLQPKSDDPTPLDGFDPRFFAPVYGLDTVLTPSNRDDLLALEGETGVAIYSLDDLLKALDAAQEQATGAAVVALKIALAYLRTIRFDKTSKADAEKVFNRLFRYPVSSEGPTRQAPVSWQEAKPLHDYLMHQAVQRAIELDLPIQIHTGIQEGSGNILKNAHPLHLVNLFIEYPQARFDLFHAGYPFQSEMAVLGKNFPNVFVDMCWLHAISPWVARQTLHEWIETIPANKIFAFGGDYVFVEGAYAHAQMARKNVAVVLAEKVETGYLAESEAVVMAHLILHHNAAQFFDLSLNCSSDCKWRVAEED